MLKGLDDHLGIDLGTCHTRIVKKGKGIVLQEPSVLAIHKKTCEIAAVGRDAWAMIGRTPGDLEVIHPLQDGVIANFDMAVTMLRHFIQKALSGVTWFQRFHAAISVPVGITDVKKRAVQDAVIQSGARVTHTVDSPLAAAMGAGLPVQEPTGSMIVDIGGGTIKSAVVSLGGIVVSHTVSNGSVVIDHTIVNYMKRSYNLAIGLKTAEEIKKTIGLAIRPSKEEKMEVCGRDMVNGLPKTISVSSQEIYPILLDFTARIAETIRMTLEKCPPELAGDVIERGIVLCGGGALLQGLNQHLQEDIGIPIYVAEHALECVSLGSGLMAGPFKRNKVLTIS